MPATGLPSKLNANLKNRLYKKQNQEYEKRLHPKPKEIS
jgi:hypothetical protein